MVITRLTGGLGNQMFQYACGKALALRHKVRLELDASKFDRPGPEHRRYALGVFNITESFAEPAHARRLVLGPENRFLKAIHARRERGAPYYRKRHYQEQAHRYDPNILRSCRNVYLRGYWQSEKYFADFAHEIRRSFTFKDPPTARNEALRQQIANANAVSVHVRRQDYVNDAVVREVLGPTGLDYYRNAIELLRSKVDAPTFYVFSDDPQWCRENLDIAAPHHYPAHNDALAGHEDMRLMSHCNHHVIANSSFGWWGAWLNPDPHKIVVAPKNWFNDPTYDDSDIIPETWIAL